MSASGNRYAKSKATRKKMSESHKGLKHTEETKAKISMARQEQQHMIDMGYAQPYRHTEATKRKLRRMARKRRKGK